MGIEYLYEFDFSDAGDKVSFSVDREDLGEFFLSTTGLVHQGMLALSWYVENTPDGHGGITDSVGCDERLVRLLGKFLFEFLFAPNEKDDPAARNSRSNARVRFIDRCHGDSTVRVTLRFRGAAGKYAQLPWEFLVVPMPDEKDESGRHVAQLDNVKVTLTRYASARPIRRCQGQLKVLMVSYGPATKPEISTAEVEQSLRKLKAEAGESEFDFKVLHHDDIDWDDIHKELNSYQPQIFHFSGHGERNALWLADHGQPDPNQAVDVLDRVLKSRTPLGFVHKVDSDALQISVSGVVALFDQWQPELSILDACDTEWTWLTEMLPTIAHQVSQKVPAVIAMRYPISNLSAQRFAVDLYRAILEGRPVDEAVQCARHSLFPKSLNQSQRAFGTPVLYHNGSEKICGPLISSEPSKQFPNRIPDPPRPCPRCGTPGMWSALEVVCVNCNVNFQCRNAECKTAGRRTVYSAQQIRVLRFCSAGCGAEYAPFDPSGTTTPPPPRPPTSFVEAQPVPAGTGIPTSDNDPGGSSGWAN